MKYTMSLNKTIIWNFSGTSLENIENVIAFSGAALAALFTHPTVTFRIRFEMSWDTTLNIPLHLRHLFAECYHVNNYDGYDKEITRSFLINEVFDVLTLATLSEASCDEEGTYAFIIDLTPYLDKLYHA